MIDMLEQGRRALALAALSLIVAALRVVGARLALTVEERRLVLARIEAALAP